MSVLESGVSRPYAGLLVLLPFVLLFAYLLGSSVAGGDRHGAVLGGLGLACCALLAANNIVFILGHGSRVGASGEDVEQSGS